MLYWNARLWRSTVAYPVSVRQDFAFELSSCNSSTLN